MSGLALPYTHVDAFADRPFGGNQAAVIPLDAWLPDASLQAIAAENLFAETAFTVPDGSGAADYELRWFTPAVEVALCGHATLASGHVLIGQRPQVNFRTRSAGILTVAREGEAYALGLPAYPPTPVPLPEWGALLGGPQPLEHAAHPGGYHILRYDSAQAVLGLAPRLRELAPLGDLQFICTAPGEGHGSGADVVSRVFVPGCGVDEDSVTGSAHAVLTPYWAERLGRDSFTAYQASARGGHVGCRLEGDRAVLSGRCVTVVEGRFFLPD